MTTLMVQIDGTTVPLTTCFWVRRTADGCAEGSLHGEYAATPEQAHKEFVPRQRDRDRDQKAGYTHELVTREQWDATVMACLLGKCEHRQATTEDGAAR
ncbi:hypothetical protein FH609_004270 [Streptomyces sp. 3MP-14]|uniref:Uncharacterized protein n=1 Tax=Streptomyces mimosae TaxID=2586635 RepID=A0A5N6A692_9ACTN|nr:MULTISPECIES: hypothetical protein [Streptomyces]KAB8162948.1 hypothetical protein FH607_020130 [Streptomyces mimosae]KAB8179162.1 hypothetical protein FH609_004270 [Streptomyces sp. 3MP-14]